MRSSATAPLPWDQMTALLNWWVNSSRSYRKHTGNDVTPPLLSTVMLGLS
jgi:hypothetical protein